MNHTIPNDLNILSTQSKELPLYRLRITQSQYTTLKDYLISIQDKHRHNLSALSRNHHYAKAFVLYASEWWRREYQGHWRWDDLLASLTLDRNTLNSNERLKLSELGFRAWGRAIGVSPKGRRSALGTFMKEGGLPISYFNANGGWLERLLQSALSYASQDKDYIHYIQENQHLIPQSAGADDIATVLCELTEDIYRLIINHHLDEQDNPILYLNDNAPNWSEQLPFPLEAQTAQTLLEKLITDSSAVRRTYKKSPTPKHEPTHWHEQLQLIRTVEFDKDLQKITLSAQLAHFNHLPLFDENNLMAMGDNISLDFYQNDAENTLIKQLPAYPIINQKRVKIIKPTTIHLNDWCAGLTLQITDHTGGILPIKDHQDNPINPYQNASMIAIDDGCPFLMAIENNDNHKLTAKYLSNGSRTTKQEMAVLYIPMDYEYKLTANSKLTKISPMLSGDLYYLIGEVQLRNDTDLSYHFKTNSQDANYYYEIKGRRLTDFIYPYLVYKKDFNIYKTNMDNADDYHKISPHQIKLKAIHSTTYKTLSQYQELFGVYELLVSSENNEVVFKTLLGIVPNEFRYDFSPNNHDGKIIFKNCSIHSISLDDNPYGICINPINKNEFLLSADELPHRKMTLLLHTQPNQNYPCLKLRCHFPSSQTLIYDDHGNKISNKTLFGINKTLMGYRIKIFNAKQNRPNEKIEFYLKSQPNIKLYLPLALKANEFVSLEPYRWEQIIKSLITLSKRGLDDMVVVKFYHNNHQGFELNFSYYEFRIHKEQNTLTIKCHQELSERHNFDNVVLDELRANHQLIAFNFNSPEHSVTLSTGENACYDLESLNELSTTDEQYAGVWFIMSHDASECDAGEAIAIRPIAHTPPTQMTPHISGAKRRQLMHQKLHDELTQMSLNIHDEGWNYLKILSEKIPHLPLIALEQWQLIKTIPTLLAKIAIYGDILFDKNTYQKYQDTFKDYWQFLNIGEFMNDWQSYEPILMAHYQKSLPSNMLNTIIPDIIKKKKSLLSEHEMFALFFRHLDNKFVINKQIAQIMLDNCFESCIIKHASNQNQFINHHELTAVIDDIIQQIPTNIIITTSLLEQHPNTKTVALLPIVMAYLSAQTTLDDELLSLRAKLIEHALAIYQIKAFDKQWFDDCFELAFGWFYDCHSH